MAFAKCDTQFGNWNYAGGEKPGKVKCAGFPKVKATKPPKMAKCGEFDNFDADSVNVDCSDKKCSFSCKEGFHSISAENAKCRSAGYWKLSNSALKVISSNFRKFGPCIYVLHFFDMSFFANYVYDL